MNNTNAFKMKSKKAVMCIQTRPSGLNLSGVKDSFKNLSKATDPFPGNMHTTQNVPDSWGLPHPQLMRAHL